MTKAAVYLLASLLPCSVLQAQVRPDALLAEKVPEADHRLTYGSDPLQFGELRLPRSKGPHSVAMLVHGGCWADHLPRLDPRATAYDLVRPLAAALTDAGIATWNVEYRRVGNPGGGWPGTFQDIAAATDFLMTIAPTYSLDLARVVVVGHSAGGQLVLWIAARAKLPPSSAIYTKAPLKIKAVVDVDGPPDLASTQALERKLCPVPAVTDFLGGTPAQRPDAYRDGSAQSFLPLGVPQQIVVGGLLRGASELVTSYERLAKEKGDAVTILPLEGANHFDMLKPDSSYGKDLIQSILSQAK
jgi:acetyl esterase/lipase